MKQSPNWEKEIKVTVPKHMRAYFKYDLVKKAKAEAKKQGRVKHSLNEYIINILVKS